MDLPNGAESRQYQNDFCIKVGIDQGRFNVSVSLTLCRAKAQDSAVHKDSAMYKGSRQCPVQSLKTVPCTKSQDSALYKVSRQ